MAKKTSGEELCIRRAAFTQKNFDDSFKCEKKLTDKKSPWSAYIMPLIRQYNPTNLLSVFTILNVISNYKFKECLIADIFSGITVGVMQIPQALAYGALTSLSPVYGLYTSFFPSVTYVLFASSRHLSLGTFALVSLMVYSSISKLEADYLEGKTLIFDTKSIEPNISANVNASLEAVDLVEFLTQGQLMDFRLKIATALCFWCGIIQVVFSIFRLGAITKYLSEPMLRGFNTAAAFHVFTTQMQHVFGIYIKSKRSKFFKIVYTYMNILENITSLNWISLAISVISVALMVFNKFYLNIKLKDKLKGVPIPIEIIIIVAGIIASDCGHLNQKYDLAIVGYIQSGLPKFTPPDISLFSLVISDAIVISIVAIASSISISDLYARKHQYKISSNKEIFAYGMANLVGSCFKCFTSAGALARTAVLESSGGKTQLVTVIASTIMFSILVWISPILEPLPKAILGSIIIVALTGLFQQISDIKHYWKLDKIDFTAWMVTFLSTLFLDIDIGLVVGLLSVLFLNTYRNQRIQLLTLGQISDYELYLDINKYDAHEIENIKIVRPTQSIYYINCDEFQAKLNEVCPLKNSSEDKSIFDNCVENYSCGSSDEDPNDTKINLDKSLKEEDKEKGVNFKAVILDMSAVAFVDEAGAKCLVKTFKEYKNEKVSILLTNVNHQVQSFFYKIKCDFDDLIYLTVKDALLSFVTNEKTAEN